MHTETSCQSNACHVTSHVLSNLSYSKPSVTTALDIASIRFSNENEKRVQHLNSIYGC